MATIRRYPAPAFGCTGHGAPHLPRRLGAFVVLDRHHITIDPKRPGLYAVRRGERIVLRYVTVQTDRLVLRPYNRHHKIELLEVDPDKSPDDWIVGRVVFVLNRLLS